MSTAPLYALVFAALAFAVGMLIEHLHRTTDAPIREAHWITALFLLTALGLIALACAFPAAPAHTPRNPAPAAHLRATDAPSPD